MAQPDYRSMNNQLERGATDGKVRNMRPDSANAEYEHARERAKQLHPINYGTFGVDSDTLGNIGQAAMPDYETRQRERENGIRGY